MTRLWLRVLFFGLVVPIGLARRRRRAPERPETMWLPVDGEGAAAAPKTLGEAFAFYRRRRGLGFAAAAWLLLASRPLFRTRSAERLRRGERISPFIYDQF
jgi:hypothetical protein